MPGIRDRFSGGPIKHCAGHPRLDVVPALRSGWPANPAMTGAAPEKSGHSLALALAW